MLVRKIFLGTNERFWDNEKALSLFAMEQQFSYANQCLGSDLIGFDFTTSSSMLSNKSDAIASIIQNIQESEICVLDITPNDKNQLTNFVMKLLLTCIELDKKVILIHNKEYSCESLIAKVKKENILGVVTHDGDFMPIEVIKIINEKYQNDERYHRVNTIKIEENDESSIFKLFINWMKEKELGLNDFWHFHFLPDKFKIYYEGYNTAPICTLIFDVSSLNVEQREIAYKTLIQNIPKIDNVFIHDSINTQSHPRKI